MRIIFAGTPNFAATVLENLVNQQFTVVAVLTQPDRSKGRGLKLIPSPVKEVAIQHEIPVLQPASLKSAEIVELLQKYTADIMVVVAYGLIIPVNILDLPKYGCINIHASLLPRWRGAAPIQRAIEAGDRETGICIMQMNQGLDTGDILLREALPIQSNDTAESLFAKLAVLGSKLCVDVLQNYENLTPMPQIEEGVTYAGKIEKTEALLNWHRSAEELNRKIRAFNPFPVAKVVFKGQELKIWQAEVVEGENTSKPGVVVKIHKTAILVETAQNRLAIKEIQKPGSKRMPVANFLTGFSISVGDSFG